MSDDEKPNPVDDLKKGLGLLFRAAKTAVDKLADTTAGAKLEDVVMSGAREVGRAVENVADTIDKELFHKDTKPAPSNEPRDAAASAPPETPKTQPDAQPHASAPTEPTEPSAPKGPRIA